MNGSSNPQVHTEPTPTDDAEVGRRLLQAYRALFRAADEAEKQALVGTSTTENSMEIEHGNATLQNV